MRLARHSPATPAFPLPTPARPAAPALARALALAALAASTTVSAATPAPDAGSLLQQVEKTAPRPAAMPALPPAAASAAPVRAAGAAAITVVAFRFEGNRLLDDQRLAAVVAPWVGRPLGFDDLQQAAAAVARAYRDAGWVVRALLPQQDITAGTVRIRVVEASFGGTQWRGEAPRRVAPDRIAAMVLSAQPAGQPLRADALDRALLLLGELPGVSVTGDLVPGAADGETALRLQAIDKPLVAGQLTFDNGGSRATGAARAVASLQLESPARLGDQATLQLVGSAGSRYIRLDEVLPVGNDGWRVGVDASALAYRLVTPDFEALDAHGRSTSWGAQTSYPLWRSRRGSLDLGIAADRQRFDNQSAGFTTSRYGVDTLATTLSGRSFDEFAGGGVDQASVGWTDGRVRPDALPSETADARNAGGFGKWSLALSRLQTLAHTWTAQAALSAQLASRNLDGSEKFTLGGPAGVRAYPAGEAGGSDGAMVNLDLRKALSDQASVSAFYDAGVVRAQHHPLATDTDPHNRVALRGLGLSTAWRPVAAATLQATWAHRLGRNADATSTGRDQDGSLVHNRFWLQASASF